MASYQELKAQAESIVEAGVAARRAEIAAVVQRFRPGFEGIRDLRSKRPEGRGGKGKSRGAGAAQVRNPARASRGPVAGRAPRWLADEQAKGAGRGMSFWWVRAERGERRVERGSGESRGGIESGERRSPGFPTLAPGTFGFLK